MQKEGFGMGRWEMLYGGRSKGYPYLWHAWATVDFLFHIRTYLSNGLSGIIIFVAHVKSSIRHTFNAATQGH